MKFIIYIFLLLTILNADNEIQGIYPNPIELGQNIFKQINHINKKEKSNNIYSIMNFTHSLETIMNEKNDLNLNHLITEKNNIYQTYIDIVKNDIVNIDLSYQLLDIKINNLYSKIRINHNNKNEAAVYRDEIEIDYLKTKENFYKFLKNIFITIHQYQNIDHLNHLMNTNLNNIENLKLKYETNLYQDKTDENYIYSKINKNIITLKNLLFIYEDFILYIKQNQNNIFQFKIIHNLKIDNFIKNINDIEEVYILNLYLKNINTSFGNISISIIFIFLLIIIFYIYKFILFFMKKKYVFSFLEIITDSIYSNIKKLLLLFVLYYLLILMFYPQIFHYLNIILIISLWLYSSYIVIQIIISYTEYYINKNKSGKEERIKLFSKFFIIIFTFFSFIFIFYYFKLNLTAILSAIGILGLALSLAAKDVLSNFFAGLKILTDGAFQQGDKISIENIKGIVIERGLINTKIRTVDNSFITIPNNEFVLKPVLNYSKRKIGQMIELVIPVHLDLLDEIPLIIKSIKELLSEHPDLSINKLKDLQKEKSKLNFKENLLGVKRDLKVFIDNFEKDIIYLKIICYTKSIDNNDYHLIKEDLIIKIFNFLKIYKINEANINDKKELNETK